MASARRRSVRTDSSASTLSRQPVSPVPASAQASAMSTQDGGQGDAVASTSSDSTTQRPSRPTRARSASFQKGVAVLRALARAPEDEVDSGYENEGRDGRIDTMPGPSVANGTQRDRAPSQAGLTEAEIQSGRKNREGLRRRREDKEVARMVGGKAMRSTTANGSEADGGERRKSKSWEIPRKIFHSSIGFAVLYLYVSETDLTIIVRNLSIFLGVVVTADVLRLNIPSFEWLYEKVLGFLMRESEKQKVNGVVWYLIGVLFCLRCLPEDIACVSIMILSWADTAASVFGRLFGRYTPPLPSPPFAARKSLAGTIAASTVATLTSALFWATPIAEVGRRRILATEGAHAIPVSLLCLGSGLVGGVAEALELGGVDDNLSLPILSALGIKAVVWAWNYFFA